MWQQRQNAVLSCAREQLPSCVRTKWCEHSGGALSAISFGNPAIPNQFRTGGFASQYFCWFAFYERCFAVLSKCFYIFRQEKLCFKSVENLEKSPPFSVEVYVFRKQCVFFYVIITITVNTYRHFPLEALEESFFRYVFFGYLPRWTTGVTNCETGRLVGNVSPWHL